MKKADFVLFSWLIFSGLAAAQAQSVNAPGGLASQVVDRLSRGSDSTSASAATADKLVDGTSLANAKAQFASVDSRQDVISQSNADEAIRVESAEEWIRKFRERFQSPDDEYVGRRYFDAVVDVRVPPTDPNFAKRLEVAYARGMIQIQSSVIRESYGKTIESSILDIYRDGSTNNESFDPVDVERDIKEGRFKTLFNKALAVVNHKLDEILGKQGVPPEEIRRKTVEQKKDLVRDNFIREAVTTAVGEMSGVVPIQTRIFTDGPVVRLAIIAIQSQKTIQFASDMRRQELGPLRGTPRKLEDLIPERGSASELDEIGLRFAYDSEGLPMLISYGRWGVSSKSGSAALASSRVEGAKRTAQVNAESYIGNFMKTQISLDEKTERGEMVGELLTKISSFEDEKLKNEQLQRQEIADTIDRQMSRISSRSKFRLIGSRKVRDWQRTDANGVIHVGSIVTWTAKNLQNTKKFISTQQGGGVSKAQAEVTKKNGSSANREDRRSRIVNDPKDF